MQKKMFVVFYTIASKKQRLYVKSHSVERVARFCYGDLLYDTITIKQLKRIYRKTDIFIEV